MNHIIPIIQTTEECNMACKYCYAGAAFRQSPDVSRINNNFKASIGTFFKLADEVMKYNNFTPTQFIFHGGEPLLIKPENYEEVLNYFIDKNYPINASLQTNGSLINEEFIGLFQKYNIGVGISIDGTKHLHNKYRVFKSDNGSFDSIFKNIIKVRDAGIRPDCLITVHSGNVNYMKEIYRFLKEMNISFVIRPISETGYSRGEKPLITPKEYAQAYCELFDLWFDDETEFKIKDFERMIAQFIEPIDGFVGCSFKKDCSKSFLSFYLSGDIYTCDCLNDQRDFYHGNILENSLETLLSKLQNLSSRWDFLRKSDCKDCNVSNYCFGGCPGHGFHYYGDYFKKDYYCEAYKSILEHVYKRVKASID